MLVEFVKLLFPLLTLVVVGAQCLSVNGLYSVSSVGNFAEVVLGTWDWEFGVVLSFLEVSWCLVVIVMLFEFLLALWWWRLALWWRRPALWWWKLWTLCSIE